MSTPFVKYCPLCAHENPPVASFCEQCDADLMNTAVAPRREESETAALETPPAPAVENAASESVPDTQKTSEAENEQATRHAAQARGGVLELELVANPALRFRVRPGQSVGRSSRADVVLAGVPDLEYISRAHARFTQRRAQWYVQYIAQGNSITVDGVESCDDAELAVYDQSIVVLSLSAFRVKLS